MSESARVASIESVKRLRGSLIRFTDDARSSLLETESTLHRTIMWLRNEQIPMWIREMRLRTEDVTRAKSMVIRKETGSIREDAQAVEERILLDRAKGRLEEARERLDRSKLWARRLERAADTYGGRTERLRGWLEADLPNASARLARMIESLEAYVSVTSPGADPTIDGGGGSKGSIARAAGESTGTSRLRWCRRLRARVPRRAERAALLDATPAEESRWSDSEIESVTGDLSTMIGELPEPVAPSDRLLAEAGVDEASRTFLVRVEAVGGTADSGWVWGRLDDPDRAGVIEVANVMPLSALVSESPETARLLGLPVGCLVILNQGVAVAVVDHNDTLRFGDDVMGDDLDDGVPTV